MSPYLRRQSSLFHLNYLRIDDEEKADINSTVSL